MRGLLYTFLSWFPVYLVEARGVQLKDVAWIGALPWVVGVIGYVLGGVVTDRIALRTGNPAAARKGMIVFGLTGTALLIAGIGLVSSLVTAVALMSAVVFLLYLTGSQYFTLISDTIPAARLGGVVGFVHFIANLSGIFAPFLVGVIVDQTKSWPLTFGVSAGICLLGVAALLIWGSPEAFRLSLIRTFRHAGLADNRAFTLKTMCWASATSNDGALSTRPT